MRTDLQGNPNRPSSAQRAYSPCRIALYPGRAPFWPPRGARRNLRMRYRLIWAVAKRRAHQSCIDRRSGPNRVGASRMAARARRRKVLRPDRPPKANARSPPDQMACFSSPAPGWLLGSRTVVLLALPVVYNDETMGKIACVALCCPAKTGPPLWWLPPIGGSQWTNAPAVLASKCLWRRQDRKKWR